MDKARNDTKDPDEFTRVRFKNDETTKKKGRGKRQEKRAIVIK